MNINPTILKESNRGMQIVDLYSCLAKDRKIFLTGEINESSAEAVILQLMYLEQEDPEREIHLYINSPGGKVQSGLMIYDVLQGMRCPVNLYCIGLAASMAAWIFSSGEKGRRFILPHARTMIHEPMLQGGVGGGATSIRKLSDSIMETRDALNQLLAKHTGRCLSEIEAAIEQGDYEMDAKASIEFGICDKVVDRL